MTRSSLDRRLKTTKKRSFKPRRVLAFSVIILLTMVLAGNIYIGGIQKRLHNLAPGEKITAKPIGTKPFNILILGKDSDNFKNGGRADTIIVARVFPKRKKAYLLSIPRDTRTNIRGHGKRKINASYAFGGVKLVTKTVEDLLDIKIDKFVVVNWKGFAKIVDLFGGVWIDVEKPMNYEAFSTKAYIHLKQGRQLLNGKKALGYVRFRNDQAGDLGRIPRQQKFIFALIDQAKKAKNIFKLPQLIDTLVDNIRTNTDVGELLWLGKLFWRSDKKDIQTVTLPGRGRMINGASYFVLEKKKMGPIENRLGVSYLSASKAKETSVSIFNASGLTGAGRIQAEALKKRGFTILKVKTLNKRLNKTLVLCSREDLAKAKAVKMRLIKAEISILSDLRRKYGNTDIVVLVGKDLAQTASLSSSATQGSIY